MTKKSLVRTLVVLAAITIPFTVAFAREPGRVGRRHPNLASAQNLAQRAIDRVEAAQRANEFDLGGHAMRAKQALQFASEEMKLAAQAANHQ